MQLGPRLGEGKMAEAFAVGEDVLKLYRPGVGPEQAEHERTVLDSLRATPLRVPRAKGVIETDGRWGLLMTRMKGEPLAARLAAAAGLAEVVAKFAALHRLIHGQRVAGLPRLKARLAARIERAPQLVPGERAKLLGRLADLPDGDRLCHGDFHPFNIMADGDALAVIDWLDATSGPPAADVARSYLLTLLHAPALAQAYLAERLDGEAFDRQAVLDWLPVLAGARLDEDVPDEQERLLALVRG